MATTPSESLEVLGVLVDTTFLCKQNFSVSDPVDEVVQSLWRATSERVDDVLTSEKPEPSIVQVLFGEIGRSLTPKS